MYLLNHISEDNIKKISPHFQVTTFIYHDILKDKTSNHILPHPSLYRSKLLKNYTHVYILCNPRYHICGIPTFQQKMVLISCKSNIFFLRSLKGSMSGDARDFNDIETRAVIMFFPARQGAQGNSHHSDRIIREIFTIVCHCQNLGGPV